MPTDPPRREPDAPDVEPVALGDFRIRAWLGTGSQGAVYRAHQISRNRPVALKLLAGSPSPTALARFRRQAELLARLAHPGVVRLHGAGAEGFDYLALEYVDGADAATLLRRAGPFAPGAALHLIARCAEALAHAAARGVVHRDVKPGNVLVGRGGEVKLTDWGAAKPTDVDHALTGEHVMLGTLRYAAPEQVRDARRADHRSDIYALGGALYELLTGRVPFPGDDWLAVLRAKEEAPLTPAGAANAAVPPRLDAVLARMLTPDPAGRFPDYAELLTAFDAIGLSREPLALERADEPDAAPGSRLDVLLVYDEGEYVPLVQHALHAAGVAHDLTAVEDGRDTLAAAIRDRQAGAAARPDVLILGLTSPTAASGRVLTELRAGRAAGEPAVCGLSRSPNGAALLRTLDLGKTVWVTGFADLRALSDALRAEVARKAGVPPSSSS